MREIEGDLFLSLSLNTSPSTPSSPLAAISVFATTPANSTHMRPGLPATRSPRVHESETRPVPPRRQPTIAPLDMAVSRFPPSTGVTRPPLAASTVLSYWTMNATHLGGIVATILILRNRGTITNCAALRSSCSRGPRVHSSHS